MKGKFSITIDGFDTIEQARGFLNWYEGQAEQDETLGEWMGVDGKYAMTKGPITEDNNNVKINVEVR